MPGGEAVGGGLAEPVSAGGEPFSLAGAGGASTVVTLPTTNPAPSRVAVEVSSVCPIKLGVTKAGREGGSATNRLILGAETLVAFAGGFCATTCPGSTPDTSILAVDPKFNPRWAILMAAARSLCPTITGISTRCGPRLSAKRTSQPRRTTVPAAGT